jgi:SAM-dependent methyltransferase
MARMTDDARLREFWNSRYAQFTLSESGWFGAGERLNHRIYDCKRQALQRALASLGLTRDRRWSVFDAGCGQGHFARFYRDRYPSVAYVGVDISERAIAHLHRTMPAVEFYLADLSEWDDPEGRTFDVVQSFEVLHLILDDEVVSRVLANLSRRLSATGTLLVTAAMPDTTTQPSDYLRHRSRSFWETTLRALGLHIVNERPMYYWLPDGGPRNKYLRYVLTRLGADVLYAIDRGAFALGLPQPASAGIDCRTQLLTIQRA